MERLRELVSQFGVRFEVAIGSVEPAEGGGRGLEVESFGFGLGEDFDGFGVGVVFAEGEDELFVLVREGVEFVQFHTAMFLAAGMGGIARRRRPGLVRLRAVQK